MRRIGVAVLLAALAVVAVAGQGAVRPRFGSLPGSAEGGSPPSVLITVPTSNPTLTTSASALAVSGTAVDDGGVVGVTWTCPECTTTSGTASGTTSWNIAAASTSAVLEDAFSSATNVNLESHTPGPVGMAWTKRVGGDNGIQVRASGNYIQPLTSDVSGSGQILYTATLATALTGTNYDVSALIVAPGGIDDAAALIAGYADTSNYCGVLWYGPTASPDVVLFKRVAGTVTVLDTADVGPTASQTVRLEVRGSSLAVNIAGVEVATATDGFCDDASGVGVGFGALTDVSGDDVVTGTRIDDVTVVDQDAATGGIALALGSNVVTVCAEDNDSNTTCDVLTVTRSEGDVASPTVTITAPTSGTTLATSTSPLTTLAGTAADDTAVSGVTWACPTCTPTSGSATGTTSWTVASIGLSAGANVITVTAADAAANTGADVLTVTYTASDTTDPTIAFATPTAGTTYTASASPLALGGTASDNVAVTQVTYASDRAPGGTATGTTNWTASVALQPGENVVTVTARDEAGNTGTDVLTVTFSPTLAISTSAIPDAYQNQAGYTFTVSALYGTAPYTWDLSAGTLPTGLSLSSAGVITGTCTTLETQNVTFRVTDAAMDTATKALSVTCADPSAEQRNDYFDTLRARGDCLIAASFQPVSGQTSPLSCSTPHYVNQLTYKNQGGMRAGNTGTLRVTYNPATDLGGKVTIPAFSFDPVYTLTADVEVASAGALTTITMSSVNTSTFSNGRAFLIDADGDGADPDDEIVLVDPSNPRPLVCCDIIVSRGAYGTTPAAASSGDAIGYSYNGLSATEALELPIGTSDGDTILHTWDAYYEPSFLYIGHNAHKEFRHRSGGAIWWEQITYFDGGPGSAGTCPGYDPDIHILTPLARSYNQLNDGTSDWTLTNGNMLGPNVTLREPVLPTANMFCVSVSTWTRWWVRIRQIANDFDLVDMWVADENNDAVQIYSGRQISVRPNDGGPAGTVNSVHHWRVEFNTSEDRHVRGDLRDEVAYVANTVILRASDGSLDGDISALLTRPRP